MELVDRPTDCYDAPPWGRPYLFIGVHHTATAGPASPYRYGSWHYQVLRSGMVERHVPEEMVAWGMRAADRVRPPWMPSSPGDFSDPNWCGIHIELVSDDGTYTEAQYTALVELVADIRARRGPLPLYGHGELQADKHDPAGLQWHRLHREDGKMDVPYISQLEADGSGYNNCGPACLAMLLAYDGLVPATREAMHSVADYIRDGVYDGDWWLGTYTDYPMMQYMLAHQFGRSSRVLGSWGEVYGALDAGRPVVLLVDNSVLQPRLYPATSGWNAHHFIVLAGYDAANFAVNDPLAYYYRGPSHYTRTSVASGAAGVGGVYALVLDAPAGEDPAVIEELQAALAAMTGERDQLNGINTELQRQIDALRAEINGLNGINTEFNRMVEDLRAEVSGLRAELASRPVAAPVDVAGVTVRLSDGREVNR